MKDLYQVAAYFDDPVAFFLDNDQATNTTPTYNFRDAKDITPKEQDMADKIASDFINYARNLARSEEEKPK